MTKRTPLSIVDTTEPEPAYDIGGLERNPDYWRGRAAERARDLQHQPPYEAGENARVAALLFACVNDPRARDRFIAAERAMLAGMGGLK